MKNIKRLTIGTKIKQKRIELKMTQKELAGNLITRNMLSQIENDIAKPSLKTIEHLAKSLNTPISYFLDNDIPLEAELNLMNDLFIEKKYIECIDKITQLLQSNPTLINILEPFEYSCYYALAETFYNNDEYNTSIEYFEKALDIRNRLSSPELYKYKFYVDMAYVYIKTEDYETAQKIIGKLGDECKKIQTQVSFLNAEMNLEKDNHDEALIHMENLDISNLNDNENIKYLLIQGKLLLHNKDYIGSLDSYKKLLELIKNDSEYDYLYKTIYTNISKAYIGLNDYKMAYDYLEKSNRI